MEATEWFFWGELELELAREKVEGSEKRASWRE